MITRVSVFLAGQLVSVFGSHLLSDRNVPAGDDFVKIDVNSFPVLTQREELIFLSSHTQTYIK